MARWRPRRPRRTLWHQKIAADTCKEFLQHVWQLDWDPKLGRNLVPPDPYIDYWGNCVVEANDPGLRLNNHRITISLVDILKRELDTELSKLVEIIQHNYPALPDGGGHISKQQALAALRCACGLYIHITPNITATTSTSLRDLLKSALPTPSDPTKITGRLTEDFCAKHLWRKGGIHVLWTNEIDKHLSCHRREAIFVFRYSSRLGALQCDADSPFPPGFIEETLRTLYLLFRPLEPSKAKRNRKYMETHFDADLELAMGQNAVFDLHNFPYWHQRLENIQQVFNRKRPEGIAQWWFDRRDRVQWTTFWIAFLVFVLTVIFGIISSVTGVLQAYAVYHSYQ